jgi:hypothetical protein
MLTILSGIIQHSRDFSTVHRNGVGMTVRAVPYSLAGEKKAGSIGLFFSFVFFLFAPLLVLMATVALVTKLQNVREKLRPIYIIAWLRSTRVSLTL